jgi:hypothetical protein
LINGVHGKKEQILKDGDVLSIFPPVAGGWKNPIISKPQAPKNRVIGSISHSSLNDLITKWLNDWEDSGFGRLLLFALVFQFLNLLL